MMPVREEVRAEEIQEVRVLGSLGGKDMKGAIGTGVIGAIGIAGRGRERIGPGMTELRRSHVGRANRNGLFGMKAGFEEAK